MSAVATLAVLLGLVCQSFGLPGLFARTNKTTNAATSLTLLYQNNLNLTEDVDRVGAILLDPVPLSEAASACAAIGEALLSQSTIAAHQSDFLRQLSYQAFKSRVEPEQLYAIDNGTLSVSEESWTVVYPSPGQSQSLPVLCTQSSNQNDPAKAVATSSNQATIASGGNTYVGFRNQKSFRFLGIRFADPPKRFEYTALYSGRGQTLQATAYGSQCIQTGSGGSEDCLFLNIQTPYIPKAGSTEHLRPVLIWIHGGGFTGGAGSAGGIDGGQLASREDIVTVTINYRLSTLGFLAVPGTGVKGNYGIADQNLALQWVLENIANFGGDPSQITLNGGSAGACSVRVHMGSPLSIGKFQGAIAMSNLGGGKALGLNSDYSTAYSSYPTIEESYNMSSSLFGEAGCNQTDADAKITCLKGVNASTIINLPTVARYVVQDGKYVVTRELVVSKPNPNTAHIPVIFGIVANDGASFSTYPKTPVTSELEGIEAALGITAPRAQSVIDSGLFSYYGTGNATLDAFNVSQRVATDKQFRCIDQASAYAGAKTGAFPAAYFYQIDRTLSPGGYDPNKLGGPPATADHPLGDPNLPYFRLHGSDQNWAFGYLSQVREPADLYSLQMSLAHFGEFIRSGQPNPSPEYLRARGYDNIVVAKRQTGPWEAVRDADGPIRHLDWPGSSGAFVDKAQCAFLGYSIDYCLGDH